MVRIHSYTCVSSVLKVTSLSVYGDPKSKYWAQATYTFASNNMVASNYMVRSN